MSVYHIKTAEWGDFDYLQDLSANALRNSPLTNAILTSSNGVSLNNVQSRNAFAKSIYQQALHVQDVGSWSKVFKSVNTSKPFPQIQACAWIQWVPADQDLQRLRHDELNSAFPKPPCVHMDNYLHVEVSKFSHRQNWTQGKPHYRTLCDLTALHIGD